MKEVLLKVSKDRIEISKIEMKISKCVMVNKQRRNKIKQ